MVLSVCCQIHWPAAPEHVERCRAAGKSVEVRADTNVHSRKPVFTKLSCFSSCEADVWLKVFLLQLNQLNLFVLFVFRRTVPISCVCCSRSTRRTFTPAGPEPSTHSARTCTWAKAQRYDSSVQRARTFVRVLVFTRAQRVHEDFIL